MESVVAKILAGSDFRRVIEAIVAARALKNPSSGVWALT
jgi:hypothetical protein